MSGIVWKPAYRYELRARIYAAGFRTIKELADRIDTSANRLSRVVAGWDFPSGNLARSMAEALHISESEFKELL